MANLLDYLAWRGDLPLTDDGFNIVDNLVLAAVSNLDFEDLGVDGPEPATFASIAERLEVRGPRDDRRLVWVPPALLTALGQCRRFRDAVVHDHIDQTDRALQFSAITIDLPDGSRYVSFRGTDNSLVGWQEDFEMSFEPMPSHALAIAYLRSQLDGFDGPVRVGGHSKGGNLALVAAAAQPAELQDRLVAVHSNDGPGQSPESIAGLALQDVSHKLVKIVPEFAVVGRIFDDGPVDAVVASSASGILQHSIMSWQVEGTGLVTTVESPRSRWFATALSAWLARADPSVRKDMTTAVFDSLGASGAELVQDIPSSGAGSLEAVIGSFVGSRALLREGKAATRRTFSEGLRSIDWRAQLRRSELAPGLVGLTVALVFLLAPGHALALLGGLAGLALLGWLAARPLRQAVAADTGHAGAIWLGALLVLGLAAILGHLGSMAAPANAVLAVALLADTRRRAKRVHPFPNTRGARGLAALWALTAALSLGGGLLVMATTNRALALVVPVTATYLLVCTLVEVTALLRAGARAELARTGW